MTKNILVLLEIICMIEINARFYADNKSKCPDSVRFKRQDKCPNVVMVWVAISPRGLSKPLYFFVRASSVDSPIYIDK